MPFVNAKMVQLVGEQLAAIAAEARDARGIRVRWEVSPEQAVKAVMGALTTLNPFGASAPVVFQGMSRDDFTDYSESSRR